MKIIAEGAVPMPPPLWPVGAAFECPLCLCRFEIETGDPFKQVTEKRIDGGSTMTIPCPTCGATVGGERPRTSGFQAWGPRRVSEVDGVPVTDRR